VYSTPGVQPDVEAIGEQGVNSLRCQHTGGRCIVGTDQPLVGKGRGQLPQGVVTRNIGLKGPGNERGSLIVGFDPALIVTAGEILTVVLADRCLVGVAADIRYHAPDLRRHGRGSNNGDVAPRRRLGT
jgi:hypothetical protein